MTNKELQQAYKYYNKRFFRDQLPKGLLVRFGRLPFDTMGWTWFEVDKPVCIMVNKLMKRVLLEKTALITLLHEMVHAKLGIKVNCNGVRNSRAHKQEIARLMNAGAYTKLL